MKLTLSLYNIKLYFIIGILSCSFSLIADPANLDHELKKVYSNEYSIDKSGIVELKNRYGKIDVKTWAKPSVKVEVTVIVKANNKSNAESKLKEIAISIVKKGTNVVATTEIESTNQSWWNSWWNASDNIKIEINYVVFMPSDQRSVIENKYGNIHLPDLNAKTIVNLKYGNLQAQNITDDLIMELSYGKATLGKVKNMTSTIAYSDIRCTSVEYNTILTTKYSKIYIDDSKTITASSKYDNYKIGNATTMTMTGAYNDITLGSIGSGTFTLKYTGMEINTLGSALTADVSYGSVTIQNLKTSFKKLVVNTSYAPIKVYGTVPCKVDISGKYFDANLGSDFISNNRVVDGSSKVIQGYKGSDRTNAFITITSKYGDVVIK
jgi:hypothetical protein